MSIPVLDTKLFVPPARPGLVARPRLDARLETAGHTRLTLVSAPAGFGKTTLLTTWLAGLPAGSPAAWVSLDERDGWAPSFWTYALTALERAAPGTGADALTLLQTGQAPIEAVLGTVLNELTVLPDDLYLVLDDYHLADTPDVQQGMIFLLDHLPSQVHLTISTRADPALPLARLRARGELLEVRAADLRMTTQEASAYLGEATGLDLTAADVAALEARTEGWVAALQLAALSLRGRDGATEFIADFAGDDRYVVDYLVEEVLDKEPDEIRGFLLATSILDRLTGPLCTAVTGDANSQQVLERLDRRNLFVVPLDAVRRTYRYHHLFADVLRARLLEERGDKVADLHSRASEWYDEAGEPVPAVRHALAAGDLDRAAALMELATPALARDRREDVILGWATALPDGVVRRRPVLAVRLVGGRMASNRFEGVAEQLDEIERSLASADIIVVDTDGLALVPANVETFRAALALVGNDPAGTIAHASMAAERAGTDDLTRASASALSALASWAGGDLDAAHRGYTSAVEGLRRAGRLADVLGCSITLADLELTQGRLRDARRTFEAALTLAADEPGIRGIADMHVGLARVACEHNDLDAAREHLRIADAQGEGLPQNPYRWRVAMAGVREAEGDLEGARTLLDEAERVYVGDFSPDVRPVAAHRARVLVGLGDLAAAREWARQGGLSADDEPTYLREFEHVTLARLLIAEGESDSARRLLDRLLAAAESGGRTGSVIEILVLQSLATGDPAPRKRALALGEPEGFVRVFLANEPARGATGTVRPTAHDQGLIEPLSDRELDVLRYLASDLDGPTIARELVVSLNTVRTHTKHIYTKLDVNNRRAAVTRAHQLGLL